MKILFICGTFEPGRDGVGDYIRRLAEELIILGNTVAVTAIYDQFATELFHGQQIAGSQQIDCLRVPKFIPANDRLKVAKKYIDDFNPDWQSLQFVPFMFHDKGLPFQLPGQLSALGKGRRWHLMFHELWVGMENEASRKMKFWGLLQKYIIKGLVQKLKPAVVHTHTQLYQLKLSGLGIASEYLPIFSNIPVIFKYGNSPAVSNGSAGKRLSLVVFGKIHSGAPVEELATEISKLCKIKKMQAKLTIVGRTGDEAENWVRIWEAAGIPVEVMGEVPAFEISELFSGADIGISVYPVVLVEKSGTNAAMLEHGLPVLCLSREWNAHSGQEISPMPGVFKYQVGNFEDVLNSDAIPITPNKAALVAVQLSKAFTVFNNLSTLD